MSKKTTPNLILVLIITDKDFNLTIRFDVKLRYLKFFTLFEIIAENLQKTSFHRRVPDPNMEYTTSGGIRHLEACSLNWETCYLEL